MTTTEDIEGFIARMALGDRSAFSAIYAATSAKLFGVTLRILQDRSESEDALQEVFIKIWRNADRYQSNGLSPMSWLITIARNHAIDRLRMRRSGHKSIDDDAVQIADGARGPEQLAIDASERARIDTCLDALPQDRARAVRGAYLDGETYKDLADRFEVPLNTMRTWLRRSLLSLRECLSP